MNVSRTFDVGVLIDILTTPEIFDAVSEDGATIESIDFDVIRNVWVEINVNDTAIGVAQFKPVFTNMYDCHINILPQHRREHSMMAGEALVEWCKANMQGSLLYTNVPVFCESVERFLINFDFEKVGTLKNAWTKGGEKHDMNIYTRVI